MEAQAKFLQQVLIGHHLYFHLHINKAVYLHYTSTMSSAEQ